MNSSARMFITCVLSCIFMLLFVAPINGGCLQDSDTAHTAADYAQNIWSYSSRSPKTPSSSNQLKFMSFNIQSGFLTNCVNNVPAQAALMSTMDYVGNQEAVQGVDTRCNCNIPNIIADNAGMSTRFVMTLPYRTGQYGINLGTTQTVLDTKYKIVSVAGRENRAFVAVKTRPAALKGRSLWFANTHIEYYSLDARVYQMNQFLDFIQTEIIAQDPQAVIVITGDFNGGPWDPVYATMKSKGFINSWERFNNNDITGGNTIPVDWPGSRFDHIWFRPSAGVTVNVKDAQVIDVRMSDHRPISATLEFIVAGEDVPPPPVAATQAPIRTTPAPTSAPATSAPTAGTKVCVGPIFETYQITINCPNPTQKITAVNFASYGTPTGSCGNGAPGFQLGSCIGGSSMAVVLDKCIGRAACNFPAANNVFGDPCPKVTKRFVAEVICN